MKKDSNKPKSFKGKTTGKNPDRKPQDRNRAARNDAPPREDSGDIIYGRNTVVEAIRSGRTIDKIFAQKGEREGSIIRILGMARDKGITVVEAEKAKLDSMTQSAPHQGIVALTTSFTYCEVDDILAYAEEKGEKPFILIIDGINDPGNLGAIIRTANASGVHGIILPKRNCCGLTSTVYKAAAGACEYAKIARVVNITSAIEELKEKGVWIYGTDGAAENDIYQTDLTGALAIVLGDEGSGISRLVKEHCDYLIKIPMFGQITSLNISVAGAVTMYEAVRQKQQKIKS